MENSGLSALLKQERYEDMALMYNLFIRNKQSFELMGQRIQAEIRQEGSALVEGNVQ
jgi:hypothetical protein